MALTAPTPTKVGAIPTMVWGTAPGGTGIAPLIASTVCTSIKIDPRNPNPVGDIENGDGAVVESILLDDGFKGTVEFLFDSSLVYPVQGTAATLVLPAGAKVDFGGNVIHGTFPILIESNGLTFERKKEAMISFNISHAPGRDGVSS